MPATGQFIPHHIARQFFRTNLKEKNIPPNAPNSQSFKGRLVEYQWIWEWFGSCRTNLCKRTNTKLCKQRSSWKNARSSIAQKQFLKKWGNKASICLKHTLRQLSPSCHHFGRVTNTSDFWRMSKKASRSDFRWLLPPDLATVYVPHFPFHGAYPSQMSFHVIPTSSLQKLHEVQSGICFDENWIPKQSTERAERLTYIKKPHTLNRTGFYFWNPPNATMLSTLLPYPVRLVPGKAEISRWTSKKAAQTNDGVQGIHAFCGVWRCFKALRAFPKSIHMWSIATALCFVTWWQVKINKITRMFWVLSIWRCGVPLCNLGCLNKKRNDSREMLACFMKLVGTGNRDLV